MRRKSPPAGGGQGAGRGQAVGGSATGRDAGGRVIRLAMRECQPAWAGPAGGGAGSRVCCCSTTTAAAATAAATQSCCCRCCCKSQQLLQGTNKEEEKKIGAHPAAGGAARWQGRAGSRTGNTLQQGREARGSWHCKAKVAGQCTTAALPCQCTTAALPCPCLAPLHAAKFTGRETCKHTGLLCLPLPYPPPWSPATPALSPVVPNLFTQAPVCLWPSTPSSAPN